MHVTASNIVLKKSVSVLFPSNFTAGEEHLILIRQKAGWAPKLAWTWWWWREKFLHQLDSNPSHPTCSPVPIPAELSQLITEVIKLEGSSTMTFKLEDKLTNSNRQTYVILYLYSINIYFPKYIHCTLIQ